MSSVTREKLESYKSMKEEIAELKTKLANLGENVVESDVILDYRSGQGIPKTIVGADMDKYWRLHAVYSERIRALELECKTVEEFVETIENSQCRRIFRMIYIDGMTQAAVSKIMHIDRSVISRRIKKYMRDKDGN